MEIKNINEYFGRDDIALDLHHVTFSKDHTCWRYGKTFLLCDLCDIPEIKDEVSKLRKRMRIQYHPDKNNGDPTLFNKYYDFLKVGGPDDETIVKVVSMISSVYKKIVSVDVEKMSIITLRQFACDFANSIRHMQSSITNSTRGINFLYIPGIIDRLKIIVNRFTTTLREMCEQVGAENVMITYDKVISDPNLPSKRFLLSEFKSIYTNTIPVVIKKMGSVKSIVFTAAAFSLHKLITVFTTMDYTTVKDMVLNSASSDKKETPTVAKVLVKTTMSPKKQKRPRKVRRRTWRDKRPTPINTNLEVHMRPLKRLERARRSVRIAKLNPRRSKRLNKA